jgi:hypothetical protein
MQRRRSFVQDKLGTREDFDRGEPSEQAPPAPTAALEPGYVGELERIAQLREQGILSEEEFQAKKKQLLGI